ncbi:MAG: prolipoprotein diacylglyceryl transferase family protein, partial [Solirubrobacterales bacterium]
PTDLPWGVRFPYGSFAYESQVQADADRARLAPRLRLPDDYFGYKNERGEYIPGLKPFRYLTPAQQEQVLHGEYRCLAVHPTQLYASGGAAIMSLILFAFWRRSQKAESAGHYRFLTKPGMIFSLMFLFYGVMRFVLEAIRDDNPFETAGLTIAQILSIGLFILGAVLLVVFSRIQPEKLPPTSSK